LPRSKTPSHIFGASSTSGYSDSSITANKSHLYEGNIAGTGITTVTVPPSIQAPRSHSVTDVSWSCADDILATGSTGGDITLWDVGRNMTQISCFSGHTRSIHCITFHPSNPAELITASQDGTLKLFDIRGPLSGSAQRTFKWSTNSSSPFRDVAYCPKSPTLIAAAQENGMVSIWDTRKSVRPVLGFQGHTCSVATLDWHPNWKGSGRNWLATAGAGDHLIKVWNFDQPAPGPSGCPSLLYSVRTSNVSRVRWRPSFHTQLVSSCNQTFDLSTYLWDLRRPYLPYASFEEHKGIVTSIAWSPCETNHFYTVGRDCLIIRHCVADGLRPAESASPVALSINVRGALAHAVSRDRVLARQPPPVVDETNLVTQSPYYLALKSSTSQFPSWTPSGFGISECPPGFYAAPKTPDMLDVIPHKCADQVGNRDEDTDEKQRRQQQKFSNLPPMGSVHSAELFVSQAQSLLYYLELSPESIRHPDTARLTTALLPDLIVALAKHYEFIGPNVDRVCSHNAAVALRFGQSFLVQFWSMLRSIYGHLPTESERRKLSARSAGLSSVTDATGPAVVFDSEANRADQNRINTNTTTTIAVTGADSAAVAAATAARNPEITETKQTKSLIANKTNSPSPTVSDQKMSTRSGVYLSEILQAIGLVHGNSRITAGFASQRSGSSTANLNRSTVDVNATKIDTLVSNANQSQQVPFDSAMINPTIQPRVLNSSTLWSNIPAPHSSVSMPRCARPHDDLFLHEEPVSPPGTPAHPPHAMSHTIAIRRNRGDSLSELSKPSSHSPQPLTTTLGASASSAQTCDSLGEPVDFLLHYASNQGGTAFGISSRVPSTGTSETDGTDKPPHLVNCKSSRRNSAQDADLIEALGGPDDPVIIEVPFLPDEAFQTRHPIEQHLYESLATPRMDGSSDRRRTLGPATRGPGTELIVGLGAQRSTGTASTRQRTVDRLLNLDPNSADPNATQHWVRKSHEGGPRHTGLKPQSSLVKDTTALHRIHGTHHLDQMLKAFRDEALDISVQCDAVTKSDSVQFLAPFNRSLDMMRYGYEPTPFNSAISPHLPDAVPLVAQWFYDLVEHGHVQTVCTAMLALGPERLRLSEWISEARVESWFTSYLELLSRFRLWIVSARIIKQCGSPRGGVDYAPQSKELRRTTLQGASRPLVGRSMADTDPRRTSVTGDGRPETPVGMRWKSGFGVSNSASGINLTGAVGATTATALAPYVAILNQASTTLSVRCGRCSKPLHASEATQRMTGHAGWACSRHTTTADPANVTCALCHLTVRGLFVWCRGCSHGGHLEHMQAWLNQRSECPAGCGHRCEYG
ncbi:WD repeat-containing protein 24, partial [Fasciola gigantica]